MPSYLVVGGGISGLAAADAVLDADPDARVTILEGSERVGGKIRGATVAGRDLDVGAEAVLARRPEALGLVSRAGLSEEVVHPTEARARIWSRGAVHPIPPRTLMGVPADPALLRGLLTDDELARARQERTVALPLPADTDRSTGDVSVAELVSGRLGAAVTERLVEPLLGGVYAGHARLLSARAVLPALLAAAERGETLTGAVARLLASSGPALATTPASAPAFATVRGGLHRLPQTLASRLAEQGVVIRTATLARELHRLPDGCLEVVTGPRPVPTAYRADRVVLALPPAPATRLLAALAPEASRLLATVETASMAVLTLALPSLELGALTGSAPEGQSSRKLRGRGPQPSGFLVPPVEGRTVKAVTFSAAKWDWVRELGTGAAPDGGDLTFLRLSIGRHREEPTLQRSDADLVGAALADLGDALRDLDPGRPKLPDPVDVHVQRWGGGLPQYAVGHTDLVARVRAEVAQVAGLAVCGATYDGVGIPACIASARAAVATLLHD